MTCNLFPPFPHCSPDGSIHRGSVHPQNLSSTSTTPATASTQPLNKWPLKPGVQVHVNSLTSLADDSKPFFNLNANTNTNSTTISCSSYQNHQHAHDSSHNIQHPLLANIASHPLQHHQHSKLNNSLLLQRNLPASSLDNKRSSSSSNSSSSSHLLNSKAPGMHTLPYQSSLEVSTDSAKTKWTAVPIKTPSDPKQHTYSGPKSKQKQRPNSVLAEFNANYTGNAGMLFY